MCCLVEHLRDSSLKRSSTVISGRLWLWRGNIFKKVLRSMLNLASLTSVAAGGEKQEKVTKDKKTEELVTEKEKRATRRHTLPSWWQKTAPLRSRHTRSHNCLLPSAALHHWPPGPALHLRGGSSESKGEPSSAHPDRITQGPGLWCGFRQRAYKPRPTTTRPSSAQAPSCGLLAMKEYFWMPCTFPNCSHPPTCCSHLDGGFYEGGGVDKLFWRYEYCVSSGFASGQKVLVRSGTNWE